MPIPAAIGLGLIVLVAVLLIVRGRYGARHDGGGGNEPPFDPT